MSQVDPKIEARHASLVAVLAAFLIEKILQDVARGPKFIEALEVAIQGKFTSSTIADQRVAWYQMLQLIRTFSHRRVPALPPPASKTELVA